MPLRVAAVRFGLKIAGIVLCCLTASAAVLAAELTDLYQAEVEANQSQTKWQQAAVSAVLVKLTGSAQVLDNTAVREALKSSGNFVSQYQLVQRDARNYLQVSLDEQKISTLLQQQQIPIWGSRRPDVLLWLTEKTLQQPAFVMLPEHPVRQALTEGAKKFGLSFVYPLFDVDDLALVNETALWSGDWSGLLPASARYQAAQVYNLLLEQQVDAAGQLSYRLTWQTLVDNVPQQQELQGPDVNTVLCQFSQQLAAQLATQYAVNVQQNNGSTGSLSLTLDGIETLTDVVAVQKLFASMLTVRQQQLQQFQPGQAVILLELAATEQDFYRALALEKKLSAVLAPDAGLPVETPPEVAVPALSDAEQAMEAALATEPAVALGENTDLNAKAELTASSAVTAVTVPLGHRHFRFQRL